MMVAYLVSMLGTSQSGRRPAPWRGTSGIIRWPAVCESRMDFFGSPTRHGCVRDRPLQCSRWQMGTASKGSDDGRRRFGECRRTSVANQYPRTSSRGNTGPSQVLAFRKNGSLRLSPAVRHRESGFSRHLAANPGFRCLPIRIPGFPFGNALLTTLKNFSVPRG